jgi:hypothetical protein
MKKIRKNDGNVAQKCNRPSVGCVNRPNILGNQK